MLTPSWIAVAGFGLALLVLGWRWRGEARDGEGFWTAGRRLGGLSVGLSVSAGFMSVSWSCVYAAQLFYSFGLGGLWLITIPWLLALSGIYYLSRHYHGLSAFSQPEMVGQRFGRAARRSLALPMVFVFLVWGGAEIYVAAKLLAPGLGISIPAMVVGIGVVVATYSMLGGLRAVVATDKMQYVLVAIYVLLVAGLAARAMVVETGSLWPAPGVLAAKSGASWMDLVSPGLATIVITFCAYLPGWLFETDLWVKVQAGRDLRAARRGMLIATLNSAFFVGLLPLFIGVAALALFPAEGGVAPAALGHEGDSIFAAIVERFAPPWMVSVAAIGLMAAAMSTIDTCANVTALSFGYDLLETHKRRRAVVASRWVMAGTLATACLFALNIGSLWDIFYLSSGVLSTSVAFPVAAVFWPRASARGVTLSSLCGFAGTGIAYLLQALGWLDRVQPEWLSATGLGYILWGGLAAALGYSFGALLDRQRLRGADAARMNGQ